MSDVVSQTDDVAGDILLYHSSGKAIEACLNICKSTSKTRRIIVLQTNMSVKHAEKLLKSFDRIGYPRECVYFPEREGFKIKNTLLYALIVSHDTPCNPTYAKFNSLYNKVRRGGFIVTVGESERLFDSFMIKPFFYPVDDGVKLIVKPRVAARKRINKSKINKKKSYSTLLYS